MPIQVFPQFLSPATLNYAYNTQDQPITAIGGTPPYTYGITGNLPVGLVFYPDSALIIGKPMVADQYSINQENFAPGPDSFIPNTYQPVIKNPSTFTVTATDSLAATGSATYTIQVGVFTEEQCISIFEMLRAAYDLDWYLVMSDMGTRNVRIGDIGTAGEGGLRMMLNAILSIFTQGMIRRMKFYISEWDKVKLIYQEQKNGGVEGITGINMNWAKDKKTGILELVKTILPAYTRSEVLARQGHKGGSDFTGSVAAGGSSGFVQLSR